MIQANALTKFVILTSKATIPCIRNGTRFYRDKMQAIKPNDPFLLLYL